jgi:hypothetical protein
VEEVPQLELDEVREALEERGLDVEGDDALVRARLVQAIEREDADLFLQGGMDDDDVQDGLVQDGLDLPPAAARTGARPAAEVAFEEEFEKKWAAAAAETPMAPAAGAEGSGGVAAGGSVGGGNIPKAELDTRGLLNAFDNALDDWFGPDAGSVRRPMPGMVTKKMRHGSCPGCGVPFQTVAKALPGYAPESKLGDPSTVCARCYGLQHYGKVDASLTAQRATHAEVSPDAFKELLSPISKKKAVVCYVVDVFDFHGSFLKDLTDVVGRNPVVLALNKADLLPRDFHPNRVKNWVYREAGRFNIWVVDVILVSAMRGYGVQTLEMTLRELSNKRKQDVYILGSANVGKSTLVNRLINRDFSLEEAPWKEERRVRGKILDDVEAQEALLDAHLRELEEAGDDDARTGGAGKSSGIYMGPQGEGWEKFVIEGGLDLGDLEDEEMSSSTPGASGATGDSADGEEAAVGEDGIDMGPKGEGWETFQIEGGLDLGLEDLDEGVDAVEEWESEGKGREWAGATAFEFEARQKESRWQRQVCVCVCVCVCVQVCPGCRDVRYICRFHYL